MTTNKPPDFEVNTAKSQAHKAFTLAEVLITLGIIGIVASLTIPNLIEQSQESQWVAGLLKFNTNLQQAILLWKNDIGCFDSAGHCLASEGLPDADITNFNQIAKFMKIVDKSTHPNTNTKDWLPNNTLNYYGNIENSGYGQVAHKGAGDGAFLLSDGTTFSMDADNAGFDITVDVNGKKPPNRIGKDTFKIEIGNGIDVNRSCSPKDICYNKAYDNSVSNGTGLCDSSRPCTDMNNTDPTIGGGAAVTAYVILNHKIPDFKALAAKYPGTFRP